MPESTDKAGTTPAAGTEAATTPAGTAAGTPKIDINAIMSENAALKERERNLSESYKNVRAFATKKAQEAARYRKMAESAATQDETLDFGEAAAAPGTRAAVPAVDPDRLATIEANQAIIQFKQDTPDYNEVVAKQKDSFGNETARTVWDEINLLLDETNPVSAQLAGATPYLTLKNAYREVRLRQFQAAKAEADRAKSVADTQRLTLRSQAVVSGQSATEGGETIDLDDPKLTAEDILRIGIESGYLKPDPRDLPLSMRRKK